jgi:crotonobetainyl-CoA:carnitine CoA-transferase CaiB-like acyl-CoA transferase
MAKRPLEGLLVLALEQAVAAPYCTSRLADAGARVIKIERKEGDFARGYDTAAKGGSSYFVWLNRGKESLAADIKDPKDAALLHAILSKADVFVQNLAPGAAARLGLDAESLRARYPRLIVATITGYGEEGPYAQMKAYDLLVQAEAGLCSVTGTPEAPGRVGVSVCDIAAGVYTYMGILEALIERDRSGQGQDISVSLFDGMAEWMTVPLIHEVYGQGSPPRVGLNHPSIAPYGAYPAGPEHTVLISIQNEREWQRFAAEVLQAPTLADDPRFSDNTRRVSNRPVLDEIIRSVFLTQGRETVIRSLAAAKIAYGELNGTRELRQHPQLRLETVGTSNGPISIVAPPTLFNGNRRRLGPVPDIGQHSDAIRSEFQG